MAYSYNEVTATGSAQLIAVPEYVDQAHIKVSINGVDTSSFTWTNASTVSVTATAGATVRVYRSTSPGARLVDYLDGMSLTEAVLDADSKQAFFLAQEQLDAPNSAAASAASATASALAAAGSATAAAGSASSAATDAAAAAASAASAEWRTSATGSAKVPAGTSAQRDTPAYAGYIRYNSTLSSFEGYNGSVWGSIGGGATGGGSDKVLFENSTTLTSSYTLTTGKNAMTVGPLTVATGQSLTVPSGQRLVIL